MNKFYLSKTNEQVLNISKLLAKIKLNFKNKGCEFYLIELTN